MPEAVASLQVRMTRVQLKKRHVLGCVDFQCAPGSHTAILGPNGAGKTTLLRAIVGLIPFEGRVLVHGHDLNRADPRERARRVAYVPQQSHLTAALSVKDVALQGRYAQQTATGRVTRHDAEVVDWALSVTDMTGLSERSFLELSGGEQRRALLARALATEASVIALDEPTAALDIAHRLRFFSLLAELSRDGRTILTVLHDLRDAQAHCDAAVVLHEGQQAYQGPATLPDELVQRVYQVARVAGAADDYRLAEPS